MAKPVTQARLKELFNYNPLTGLFTRRVTRNRWKAGTIAGSVKTGGYIQIKIDGKDYTAHRLAFLYVYGSFPDLEIDHIDHVTGNNIFSNLREVTLAENMKNRPEQKNNSSGVTGVFWSKSKHRWQASISVDGVLTHLGTFTEFHQAVDARKNAEVLYNFHENHGK